MSLINEISKIWIRNIKNLDNKNHLVHGEIYAADGSVSALNINSNTVTAKVEGAPGDFFDVEIKFKELTNSDKKRIVDYILDDYLIYNDILNNQISEELLELDVGIIPESLKDFKMTCSCEKGLFCKHKAAVFHKIRNEIKKNPFLVFSLRGLDLKEEIPDSTYSVKKIRDVVKNDKKAVLSKVRNMDFLTRLYFTLPDYPSFYSSKTMNFKEVILDTLNSMGESVFEITHPNVKDEFVEYIILGNTLRSFESLSSQSHSQIQKAFEDKWMNPQEFREFKINIDGNYEIISIITGEKYNNFGNSNLKRVLFSFFAEMIQADISGYSDTVKYVYKVFRHTLKLIYQYALIPEFFKLDNKSYHIRWIPVFDRVIYSQLVKLYDKCPDNLITFYDSNLSKENQVNTLISLFFEGFSDYYFSNAHSRKINDYLNEFYFRLFFLNSQDFVKFRYSGHEREVDNWINVLYLAQKDYNFKIDSVQSNLEFILELTVQIDDKDYSIGEILQKRRSDIINDISIIENVFSKFNFFYDLRYPRGLDLREYNFFSEKIAPVLKEIGIAVNTPFEFDNSKKARLVLDTEFKSGESSLSLDDLVDFDWKVAIGDEKFSVEEFKTFAQNYKGLVKIRDKYYVIDKNNLNQLKKDISKLPNSKNKSDLLRYLLSSDSENLEINTKLENLINNVLEVKDIEVPQSLNGSLRDYQKTGFSWMVQNMQLGFGSILADDMGLGKTIQLLALVLYLKENKLLKNQKVLIVAPTGILTNWAKEIEKFASSLEFEVYHGMNRQFPKKPFDILLTSYGMIRQDLDYFNAYNWFLLVIDEAQNIKNPNTKQTKAIKAVKARHHIAMSGTPIENHLAEYWSIFDFINKGYLFDLKHFKQRFLNPIEKNRDELVLSDFKKITSPFILRRLKTDKDIIKDLPDKIINDIYCNLTVKQASMYEETLNQLLHDVGQSEGIQRKGLVLKLINSLKQICNHPSQFMKSDKFKVADSGKMEVLINILENILDNDEKVLIFTQYVEMGKIIKKLAEDKFREEVLFFHGGVTRKKRDEMIERFQNDTPKIFILSLKAGGTGLNLTAASNVIHYDLWWNPAVENQATDRAYRIGQTENVMVYRFITTGTLEERINQILLNKMELVEMTIEGNESFITEMSDDELRDMLDLRGMN